MTINPTIQANKRITFLHELESTQPLIDFINHLDQKYGVDSTDPDNTFGRINPNQSIIQHGVDNTLYFAQISTYYPNEVRLPKHKFIPHANTVLFIDNKFNVGLAQSQAHMVAKREPITIEPEDIEQLKTLRQQFAEEVKQHKPAYPNFSEDIINKHMLKNNFEDLTFDMLSKRSQSQIYDDILKEQGYADGSKRFKTRFVVPLDGHQNHSQHFVVEYYRLSNNSTPHFSTTYNGWQNQNDMDHNHPAYQFYKKWDMFHVSLMTNDEFDEMMNDLEELKKVTRYRDLI